MVSDGARVLLVKRAAIPRIGFWALPAGYMDADELPEDALAREVAEETGRPDPRDRAARRRAVGRLAGTAGNPPALCGGRGHRRCASRRGMTSAMRPGSGPTRYRGTNWRSSRPRSISALGWGAWTNCPPERAGDARGRQRGPGSICAQKRTLSTQTPVGYPSASFCAVKVKRYRPPAAQRGQGFPVEPVIVFVPLQPAAHGVCGVPRAQQLPQHLSLRPAPFHREPVVERPLGRRAAAVVHRVDPVDET